VVLPLQQSWTELKRSQGNAQCQQQVTIEPYNPIHLYYLRQVLAPLRRRQADQFTVVVLDDLKGDTG
jgi:hypothetical protein